MSRVERQYPPVVNWRHVLSTGMGIVWGSLAALCVVHVYLWRVGL